MRTLLFTAFIIGISLTCHTQENKADTSKVVFTPPVVVKDESAKSDSDSVVKFSPPVIVKDEPGTTKKDRKEKVKFTPPVIVKDSAKER